MYNELEQLNKGLILMFCEPIILCAQQQRLIL